MINLDYFRLLYAYLNARIGEAGGDERGSLTLEQVIIAAVLSAAAIAAGVVIVAAINTHQANIK